MADKGRFGDNFGNLPDGHRYAKKRLEYQNDILTKSTATRLAKQHNLSRATIYRDAKLAGAIDSIGTLEGLLWQVG